MTQTCPNCDRPIDAHASCWHCRNAHVELLERLNGQDEGVATIAGIAIVAVHGPQETPERVWWVR